MTPTIRPETIVTTEATKQVTCEVTKKGEGMAEVSIREVAKATNRDREFVKGFAYGSGSKLLQISGGLFVDGKDFQGLVDRIRACPFVRKRSAKKR